MPQSSAAHDETATPNSPDMFDDSTYDDGYDPPAYDQPIDFSNDGAPEDLEVENILIGTSSRNTTENISMSPSIIANWFYKPYDVDRFLSTPTDPHPIYSYGEKDNIPITMITANVVVNCLNILSTFTKKFKLESDYFDFMDDLDFDDIATTCSSVREDIEFNRSLGGNTNFDSFDTEAAKKWGDIMKNVEIQYKSNKKLVSDFFQLLQLVQHAKRLTLNVSNAGNFNFWKSMSQEEEIRAVFETCNPDQYPFFFNQNVDESMYILTLAQLEREYKIGYDIIKEFLNNEEPFLQLSGLKNLSATEIDEFKRQLIGYCKAKTDDFEANEQFQNEQYLFAQSILTGLRAKKFSKTETKLDSIIKCMKIRNAFLRMPLSVFVKENCYVDQRNKQADEEIIFKDEILPKVEKITLFFQQLLKDGDHHKRKWNELKLRMYLTVLAHRYVKIWTGGQNLMTIYEACVDDMSTIKEVDSKMKSDLAKLDEFAQTCNSRAACDMINTICWNVYKEVGVCDMHMEHQINFFLLDDFFHKSMLMKIRFLKICVWYSLINLIIARVKKMNPKLHQNFKKVSEKFTTVLMKYPRKCIGPRSKKHTNTKFPMKM